MNNQMIRPMLVEMSQCDYSGRLGLPNFIGLCMDIATDHANELGIGSRDFTPKGLFWLCAKTHVVMKRRPVLAESVTLRTWPEKPDRVSGNRDYELLAGEELLAAGKTSWALFDQNTGRLCSTSHVYPEGLEILPEQVLSEPFHRVRDDFTEAPFAEYRVQSTDIDLVGHMNNAAYVRAFFSLFSTKELTELDIRELEIHYKNPCFEGELLSLQRREKDGFTEVRLGGGDGRTVAFILYR